MLEQLVGGHTSIGIADYHLDDFPSLILFPLARIVRNPRVTSFQSDNGITQGLSFSVLLRLLACLTSNVGPRFCACEKPEDCLSSGTELSYMRVDCPVLHGY